MTLTKKMGAEKATNPKDNYEYLFIWFKTELCSPGHMFYKATFIIQFYPVILLVYWLLFLSLPHSISCLRSKFNSHHGGRFRHAQWAGRPADTRWPDSWWGTVEDTHTHLRTPGQTCIHTNTDVTYSDIGEKDKTLFLQYSIWFRA